MGPEWQAEWLKQKGQFRVKMLWLTPLVTVALALVLMAGHHLQVSAYNWWYTLMLPATLTVFVSFATAGEKRHNRHGLFSVVVRKKRLWLAQAALYVGCLLATVTVFCLAIAFVGRLFMEEISPAENLLASAVLFLCMAWQIPLWMWLTEKTGAYLTFFVSMVANIGMPILFSETERWWLPFALPARLMCPLLKVQPNGLLVEEGSHLLEASVLPVGVGISVLAFVAVLFLTAAWFERKAV